MNRTVSHGWTKDHPLSARDDSSVPSSWGAEAMERKFRWPLGRRPDDHPSLSQLGL